MKRSQQDLRSCFIEGLRSDHERATRLLALLIERMEGLVRSSGTDLRIAVDVFRYMVDFVDVQHHDREDLLFEMVGSRSSVAAAEMGHARREHVRLKREGSAILAKMAETSPAELAPGRDLVRRMRSYADLLEQHFRFEESRLFNQAESVLTDADWLEIKAMQGPAGDPVFGPEVEAEFRLLHESYVNQVREIGKPAPRHASLAAAAMTDSLAELYNGARSMKALMRETAAELFEGNIDGIGNMGSVRDFTELHDSLKRWSLGSLGLVGHSSLRMVELFAGTARSAIEPFVNAFKAERLELSASTGKDISPTSWQAHVTNLMLRATVKRIASGEPGKDFEIPTQNIELPPTMLDRFIPQVREDVAVEMVELDNAFAERFTHRESKADKTILFFPGGGFMMAPTQVHRLMAARLARTASAVVVMVHYRLAPEHRFPAGLDDCVEAYRRLLADGVSPQTITVIGDSAGGGMALSSMLRIRAEGLELPRALVLLSPVTDLSYSGESRQRNGWFDPSMPADDGNFITRVYLGDTSPDHPIASPFFGDLSGLPPTLIQVGSTEILLDDALRVAAKIRSQGGRCECEVWHDMPHDWMLFGILPEARKALRKIVDFIETEHMTTWRPSARPCNGDRFPRAPACH